ncbi:MAG: hypothetical protein U1E78_12125 [Gammaproteobacteria bacterium]
MIFRVGAKPLSNRSVHKVHEDCEVGAGNPPTLLRATDRQATPKIHLLWVYLSLQAPLSERTLK